MQKICAWLLVYDVIRMLQCGKTDVIANELCFPHPVLLYIKLSIHTNPTYQIGVLNPAQTHAAILMECPDRLARYCRVLKDACQHGAASKKLASSTVVSCILMQVSFTHTWTAGPK